ncbi:ATP synthase F1 subunit epsilon [Methylobacterium sp. P31]
MSSLFAELISPERVVFAGEIRSVVLPGVEGDMTVLAGHAPLMTALHPGIVFATDADGIGRRAFVRGAFVEVTADRVTILAERVLPVEELTATKIDEEVLHLQMERDAAKTEAVRAHFDVSIGRLEEFKASLGL